MGCFSLDLWKIDFLSQLWIITRVWTFRRLKHSALLLFLQFLRLIKSKESFISYFNLQKKLSNVNAWNMKSLSYFIFCPWSRNGIDISSFYDIIYFLRVLHGWLSVWTIVRMNDCPYGQLSAWTIVWMDYCPHERLSSYHWNFRLK